MLLSVALILLVGMGLGWLCRKVKLPGLLGMLVTGIVITAPLGAFAIDLSYQKMLDCGQKREG